MTATGAIAGETQPASFCSQCGQAAEIDGLLAFGRARVCAACKPLFVGRLIEGGGFDEYRYAGFWPRLAAKIIDGLITASVDYAVGFAGMFAIAGSIRANPGDALQGLWGLGFFYGFQFVFGVAYDVVFLWKLGATPGKLALGMRVITPGSKDVKLSLGKAFGRHFAQYVTGFTIFVGYLMALFDSERQTLHDRICNTRVILTK